METSYAVPQFSPQLAFELVANLSPQKDILKKFRITLLELKDLLANPQFKMLMNKTREQWDSPMNAEERTRMRAMMALEDAQLQMYEIIHDNDINPGVRVDAYKQLRETAGVVNQAQAKGSHTGAGGIHISVNLNGKQATLDFTKPPLEVIAANVDEMQESRTNFQEQVSEKDVSNSESAKLLDSINAEPF